MDPENGRMVALTSGSAGVLNRTTSFRRIILPALGKALRTACASPLVTLEGLAINGPPITGLRCLNRQLERNQRLMTTVSFSTCQQRSIPGPASDIRLVTRSPARSGGGALAGGPPDTRLLWGFGCRRPPREAHRGWRPVPARAEG